MVFQGQSQEWTRFRGPNGTGVGDAPELPVQWTDSNILWSTDLEGVGHSSPVLWGNKLWITTSVKGGSETRLLCIDATNGATIWEEPLPMHAFRIHQYNSFASPTPAVDGERVYISWTVPEKNQIAAYTHEGDLVWSHDLGPFESQHGGGVSPVVVGDHVILANDQLAESFLIAFDAATGDIHWRLDREAGGHAAYSTPCVYDVDSENPYLVFNSSAHGITAVSIKDGKRLWELGGLFDKRSCSSPVFADGVVFGSCGSGGGGNYVVAVKPPSTSDGKPELMYEVRRSAPYVPSALIKDERAYLWSDGGIVTCMDLYTGEEIWRERAGGDYFASPIRIGDHIFNISTEGEVVVIKAADEFEVVARYAFDEKSHATPAVANGRMYVRTVDGLYCVGAD